MRGGVTKHTVVAICGHDYEVTLNGSHIGRMIKLDRLEKGLCSYCQGKMSSPIEDHAPGDEQGLNEYDLHVLGSLREALRQNSTFVVFNDPEDLCRTQIGTSLLRLKKAGEVVSTKVEGGEWYQAVRTY